MLKTHLCFLMLLLHPLAMSAIEGRIEATLKRGNETQTLRYTIGVHQLRVERVESDRPYPKDIVDLDTGTVTLLLPHNRSFVRLKQSGSSGVRTLPGRIVTQGTQTGLSSETPSTAAGGEEPAPVLRPALIGPTGLPGAPMPPQVPHPPGMPQMPAGFCPQSGPGASVLTPMPGRAMVPAMPMEPLAVRATTDTTNLLGYVCTRYELRQRGETMEIWATDQLLPFQPYQQNEAPRFGPRRIEDQWGQLLNDKKVFPLLATLKSENGPERLRFEVTNIKPEQIKDDDAALFRPPPDYHEMQALPL
jgi:hypothetical protein